ncbi:MAG: lmo0937 family membrane protein [Bacteroidia bacterium]
MSGCLYIVAIILVIGWILGFFYGDVGDLIHILLVLAIIAVLIRIIGGRRIL